MASGASLGCDCRVSTAICVKCFFCQERGCLGGRQALKLFWFAGFFFDATACRLMFFAARPCFDDRDDRGDECSDECGDDEYGEIDDDDDDECGVDNDGGGIDDNGDDDDDDGDVDGDGECGVDVDGGWNGDCW